MPEKKSAKKAAGKPLVNGASSTASSKGAASAVKAAPAKLKQAASASSKDPAASGEKVANAGGGKVAIGKKIPAFTSLVTGGGSWKSGAAAGNNLVIYFYPRDNTPGCTQQGQDFRDLAPAFKKANTMILGVSTDSLASHDKFKASFQFPFELLSDEGQQLCQLFGVIKEKSMYGRKFIGVERSTFLVDAAGILRNEWRKVKVPGHAQAVLEAAKAL